MRPDSSHEGKRWFAQALRDLDDARFAYGGKRFNLVCFLCQQAAEKAIKGYLYAQGSESVWGHSVVELCADAESFDDVFSSLKKIGGVLDRYYIPTRYPNGLPGGIPAEAYQEEDAQKAISMAEEVIQFIRERMVLE